MTSNISFPSSSSPFGKTLDHAGPPLLFDLFVAMMTVVLPLLLHQRVLQPCHLVVVVGLVLVLVLVGLLLMVMMVVVWACQWIGRLESYQEKLMNLTALLMVLFMIDDTSYELRHSVRHPVLPWGTTSHIALIVLNQRWRFVTRLCFYFIIYSNTKKCTGYHPDHRRKNTAL